MAHDLAKTPASGVRSQLCGDCHLLNFGLFASAERRLIFDINDFDETLPGPWEWDVKRLAASVAVAGRDLGVSDRKARDLLARAHAKSGDATTISGYLGKSDAFDEAVAKFALAYADQTERDHKALERAARAGRIKAIDEND